MSKQHASDTPETDRYYREELGVYGKGFPSPCDFARRLERERNELREWKREAISVSPPLQEIGREIGLTLGAIIHDKILPELIRRREEIDELRKERDELQSEIKMQKHRVAASLLIIEKTEKERGELREALAEMTKNRDTLLQRLMEKVK